MDFILQTHTFTGSDIQELKTIGYKLVPDITDSFESFMQSKFPNFNLLSLLKVVEMQFSGTTDKNINRIIKFDESDSRLSIDYQNEYTNEDDALLFVREFSVIGKSIGINHMFCVIPKSSRNKGLIKPVFQESLQQYVNVNARKISVHAGLSGGGYTWAKHGFVAINRSEVEVILQEAKHLLKNHEFNVIKRIYDTYYAKNPKGRVFPMDLWAALDFMKPVLMGSDWHGELDLKNKEQFRNFKDYVFR